MSKAASRASRRQRRQILTTYRYPDQLRIGITEDGTQVKERIPGHPTRPARATDESCWWEDLPLQAAVPTGSIIREVHGEVIERIVGSKELAEHYAEQCVGTKVRMSTRKIAG